VQKRLGRLLKQQRWLSSIETGAPEQMRRAANPMAAEVGQWVNGHPVATGVLAGLSHLGCKQARSVGDSFWRIRGDDRSTSIKHLANGERQRLGDLIPFDPSPLSTERTAPSDEIESELLACSKKLFGASGQP